MFMMFAQYTLVSLYVITTFHHIAVCEKVTFINVEHPRVTYYNPVYLKYANLTTTRYGRRNPVYYVGLHFESLVPFDRNIVVDFYFLELFTNVYKPSFIEFHYNWCSLLEKDQFFGAALRQGKLLKPCPHPPGIYNLYNMTINPAIIPKGFPFTKGRIVSNLTLAKTKERIADGYIDMTLSQVDNKRTRF